MKVSRPVPIALPANGVYFAESVHDADFRMGDRADPFHKLVYVLRGEVVWHDARWPANVTVRSGTVLILPRDVRHHFEDREPAALLLLCLAEAFWASDTALAKLWTELLRAGKGRMELDGAARERIEMLWRRALLEQARPRLGCEIAIRGVAEQLLVTLARRPAVAKLESSRGRVADVVREIAESFYEEWDMERAAARTSLSRRRFSTLFMEVAGETFYDHLTRLRLEHAAELLRSGDYSVIGTMFSCGFGDTSHFYRLFKARYGAPPQQWVAQQRARAAK
jgi:AraC-like DNA-binding protein